jgi:hypothetical protein
MVPRPGRIFDLTCQRTRAYILMKEKKKKKKKKKKLPNGVNKDPWPRRGSTKSILFFNKRVFGSFLFPRLGFDEKS